MKKAFRWGCVILSVVTICAWALLLHQAKQPWKLIGVNETPDSSGEAKPGQTQIDEKVALAGKADIASPGEGDRMLDPILVQQEREQDSPEINGTSGGLFRGPGPMAAKSRHHRAKKSTNTAPDSSADEETRQPRQTHG